MSDTIQAKRAETGIVDLDSDATSKKSNESELIEHAKYDPQTFGELYDLYYDRILNYIYRRILDIGISEELTSNTFFNALNALPKYRHKSSFRAWLYRIATNEIKIFYRSKKNRLAREHEFYCIKELDRIYFTLSDLETEEEHADKTLLYIHLHETLNTLPEKYRSVLVLRYFEELKYDEIAQVMGKRVGTVKSLVHRGLKRFRILMDKYNATFS